MAGHTDHLHALLEKIASLLPNKVTQLEECVDYLHHRFQDQELVHHVTRRPKTRSEQSGIIRTTRCTALCSRGCLSPHPLAEVISLWSERFSPAILPFRCDATRS